MFSRDAVDEGEVAISREATDERRTLTVSSLLHKERGGLVEEFREAASEPTEDILVADEIDRVGRGRDRKDLKCRGHPLRRCGRADGRFTEMRSGVSTAIGALLSTTTGSSVLSLKLMTVST